MAKNNLREKSPWLKSVLIPFWIIQVLFMIILLGALGYVVSFSLLVYELVLMVICIVCIVLDITEIILFARHKLQPLTYLVLQCKKTILWSIVFLVTIINTTKDQAVSSESDDPSKLFLDGFIEAIVLLISFIATLIYGSVIYHRHRVARRHRLAISSLDHERYDRYYNGPYSENGIAEATYERVHSPSMQHTTGSPTFYGEYPSEVVESDAHTIKEKPLPLRPLEWSQELDGDGELHELATTKSIKSLGRREKLMELPGLPG